MRHLYKIGETVTFQPSKAAQQAANGSYKIVQLMPIEYGVCRYRIKNLAEVYERVATEAELARPN